MRNKDYVLLKNMLRTNREFLNSGKIEFDEYLDNHRTIMAKIKSSIVKMEDHEFNIIKVSIEDQNLSEFKSGILILKQIFN